MLIVVAAEAIENKALHTLHYNQAKINSEHYKLLELTLLAEKTWHN